ncbi:unnamed protein product, partial [Didymodactylos carnosus]
VTEKFKKSNLSETETSTSIKSNIEEGSQLSLEDKYRSIMINLESRKNNVANDYVLDYDRPVHISELRFNVDSQHSTLISARYSKKIETLPKINIGKQQQQKQILYDNTQLPSIYANRKQFIDETLALSNIKMKQNKMIQLIRIKNTTQQDELSPLDEHSLSKNDRESEEKYQQDLIALQK